jgi:hypothetical protein
VIFQGVKALEEQAMDQVQNKDSSDVIPSPKASREEIFCLLLLYVYQPE